MSNSRIVIIEDEKLVATLLESCLRQVPGITIAGNVQTGAEGVELCLKLRPDLVLLDIELPGISGIEVARALRCQLPETRIIVVSSHCEPFAVHELNHLGIQGFIDKGSSMESLQAAIIQVLRGKNAYCPVYTAVILALRQQAESYQKILTPREISVLVGVAEGLDDLAIAKKLGITANTTSTHRRNIRQKLGAHNDRDLVNYARQWGLIPLSRPA